MNAVVTGASRGIGYELVKELCRGDGNTVIAISRDQKKLEKLQKECAEESPEARVFIIPFDLGGEVDWEILLARVKEYVDHVHILVNNAGTLVNKPFAEMTMDDAKGIFDVNYFAAFGLIKTLLPLMGGASSSHIVNIGSMGGVQGSSKFSGLSAYSSSKGALAILSECLAEELKDQNVKVNCLALGAVQTEMLEEAFPGYQAPLQANEMAEFIALFAEGQSKYMNGKVVSVSLSTP